MPHIEAFHGLRYDLGHVGSLSDVVAPPYDIVNAEMQNALYKRHPSNVIRLILNRDEPGDDDDHNRYTRAARFLKNWRREGVLQADPQAAMYVYHQAFDHAGTTYCRRGFMCRVRLERFGEGNIFPHEETHAAAKADRLRLINSCRANLSQIFGLYPDPDNEAQDLLESATVGAIPVEATDHLGVVHRVWPVVDDQLIAQLSAIVGPKPMYIADGHHRYETACDYRDQLAASGKLTDNHSANYVLTMCVGMSDPGMIVLPTHRLFRGLADLTFNQLGERLGDCFSITAAGGGADAAYQVWEEIETEDQQGTLGFYTAADDRWLLARITPAGAARMADVASDHSTDWQQLGVSLLHRLVIDELLGEESRGAESQGEAGMAKPMYVHDVAEVIQGIEQGDAAGRDATGQQGTGGRFPLAALVMPATLEHIRQISHQQERMPAKSTYFYPKLLSGLIINSLE